MATFRKENPNVEEQEEQNYLTGYGIVPLGPTGVIRGGAGALVVTCTCVKFI